MPTLTIFVGLPGSGKSHAAKEHAQANGLSVIEDAFHPDHQDDLAKILEVLETGDCVIDSVQLTQPVDREGFKADLRLQAPAAQVNWVFFANDPLTCICNIISDCEVKGRSNWKDRIKAVLAASKHFDTTGLNDTRPVFKAHNYCD